MIKIFSIGDCNTKGIKELEFNFYPERLGKKLNASVFNYGFTMSSTREGKRIFNKFYNDSFDIITIQFGLVDSWKTFKYSPYVLYYPNNFLRKMGRKFLKKYKKLIKKCNFYDFFGMKNVVDIEEYERNIRDLLFKINKNNFVLLIDTIPNKELSRNVEIKKYNQILKKLSGEYNNCIHINLFNEFENNFDKYYYDKTHINSMGYDFITQKILSIIDLERKKV